MSDFLQDQIEVMALKACEEMKCRLYDLVFVTGSKGKGRVVRLFIDRRDQSASLEDCEKVSKALSELLDAEDLIEGNYTLEVSTPGIERTLRKDWHFKEAHGEKISLSLKETLGGKWGSRKNFKGKLELVQDSESSKIRLVPFDDSIDEEIEIPLSMVHKGQVIYTFENNKG